MLTKILSELRTGGCHSRLRGNTGTRKPTIDNALAFVLLSGVVFFGWGEIFSLFPSTLTDTFGTKNATTNYGFLYMAQGIGSVLGGPVAAMIRESTGSWMPVFGLIIVMDVLTGLPHVKGGALKALAVTTKQRSALLPELPSMDEAGVKGFDITSWQGYLGPANMPKDIVTKLNAEIRKIVETPSVKNELAERGMEAFSGTPESFDK